jgi:transcriptional regulator with XRE-family HTH domain|tara:strand:+ start:1210 stop:1467 length:258 start_codon:yes stop_codon:yes gene_type:complete
MTTVKKPMAPHWIAKEIKVIREERGLSQFKLANMAGCTQAGLANFESGKANMNLIKIDAVLEALGYEIEIQPGRTPIDGEENERE